jgi:hypothetical protein
MDTVEAGRRGGAVGGKSRSTAKRRAARENAAKARVAWAAKLRVLRNDAALGESLRNAAAEVVKAK